MNTERLITAPDDPSPDEIAAALAAVEAYLAAEQVDETVDRAELNVGWRQSAKLSVQYLRPAKTATPPRWNTIERLRRATSGNYGIVGL